MQRRTAKRLGIGFGVFVVAIVALIFFWSWDWFIPIVQSYASSTLGRKVTLTHLHVALGRVTRVEADGLRIADKDGFPADKDFFSADRLIVSAKVMPYINGRHIVVPLIQLDKPVIYADREKDGSTNWDFALDKNRTPSADNSTRQDSQAPSPQIGNLKISDGTVHYVDAKLKADVTLGIHTTDPDGRNAGTVDVKAKGVYAGQPITGTFVGGALLTLRDNGKPYPVDLHLANGPTKLSLKGTLDDPIKFAGANLKLDLAGPDMSKLYPLTGIPIPETPRYDISGNLDYARHAIKFHDFHGTVGSSDLNGDIDVDRTGKKPVVDANLTSHKVDLTDLAGFIGETPGRKGSTPQSAQQKKQLAKQEASKTFLPDTPINLPKVKAANVRLRYKGERIEGKYVPLDNIVVALDIDDGRIRLHPLQFAVGKGKIKGDIDLTPHGKNVHAVADVDFQQVDLSRLLQATHLFHGQGIVGGKLELRSTGDSIASLMADGDGGVKLFIQGGGNISALLTDLIGLQFGDALLSALGVPQRADLQCFVSDLPLNNGILRARTILLDTSETRVIGKGDVDFKNEHLNLTLAPQAKHFTIGSLPTPIDIKGTLKSPSIMPQIGSLAVRGGLAAALGVALPPLALLPTIQFGVGEDGACTTALRNAHASAVPAVHGRRP